MTTGRISAVTQICWLLLLLLSLSLASAGSERDASGREAKKASPLEKWRSNFDEFVKKAQSGAGKALNDFWKPKKEFFEMAHRYQKWHGAYSKLCSRRKEKQSGCLPARELFLREYSKLDGELYVERRAREWRRAEEADELPQESAIENADHLFELLGRLIAKLEALQGVLERELEPLPSDFDKGPVEESMERLKRIVVNTAQSLLKGEALEFGRLVAFKVLALIMAAMPPEPGSPLSLVAPIIALLGNPAMSVPAHYLLDIQIRTVLNTANQLNPVPRIFQEMANKFDHRAADLETASAESSADAAGSFAAPATAQ